MNNLIERAKAILLSPKPTWVTIKGETTTVGQVYTGFLVPLAAIPAGAMLIRHVLFGSFHSLGRALLGAILSYALTLLSVFIAGKVIDALAPSFGAIKSNLNAFRVAAYSWTPALIAGILGIIPFLAPLGLLAGLYGIYLLYLGVLILMACPPAKAVVYTIVCVVVMFVLFAVTGAIVAGATVGFGASSHYGNFGGSKVAEKMVEVGLAKQGVKARLDTKEGKLTMETKEGSATYAVGGDVKLPGDFPKDVFVYGGAKIVSSMTMPKGCHLTLQTKDSADKVINAYKREMTTADWKEESSMNQSGVSMLSYKKSDRTAAVVAITADNQTTIQLTISSE
jgi:hypothetical protein